MRSDRSSASTRGPATAAAPHQRGAGRGDGWWHGVGRDARVAMRALRRTPAFTAIAVFCLAVGIGANAAIFSVVNAVLLRPLPYAEPERLVRIYEHMKDQAGWTGSVSQPNFVDWRAQNASYSQLAAYTTSSRILEGGSEPERVRTLVASANLPALLGVQPLLGRTFGPGEDEPGAPRVALLGEGMWRRRFGADPAVLGRAIRLDDQPYVVVGVMPDRATFPAGGNPMDVWIPYVPSARERENRGSHFLAVVGRLKPGVTIEQAQADLSRIADRLEQQYPDAQANRGVLTYALRETVVGDTRPALLILLGAVGLVLLIACANVANLLLARAATRRHEVALRLALGAGRGRLVRQLLVESLLLAAAGAVAGTALAWLALRAIGPLVATALPVGGGVPLDMRVFAFLAAVSVVSGLLFGLVPALQASRADVRGSLVDAGGKSTAGGGQQRLRGGLVVAEIALSLVLLVGAGLLMRGFVALRGTPPGLDPTNVLTAHIAIPDGKYDSTEAVQQLLRPILERARAIPGVTSASMINLLPIQSAWTNGSFRVVGQPVPEPGKEPIAELRFVGTDFFRTLGIPVLRGRDFQLREAQPVVIINEALAKKHFPDQDPIGRQLAGLGEQPLTIVGVVGSVRQAGLDQAPLKELYFPLDALQPGWVSEMTVVLRTTVEPAGVTNALRRSVRSVDPGQPVYRVLTMEEVVNESLADRRLHLWLLGGFAAVALLLAAAGLYGVISYLVAQRTREIGIRVALGAQPGDVVRLVMRHGALLTLAGVAAGLVGAFFLTRLLSSLLYGVSARDPVVFGGFAAALAAVALLATWVPARRATRVDPVVALRTE
ncbi:MAG TPA: ABC transporter permease [Gemmatimonadaceae bacterium]|nr:ABC transporter permease [Gemmatimonadaceae bacterium]